MLLLPDIAEIFGVSLDGLFGREQKPLAAPPALTADTALPWADDDNYYAVLYRGHRLLVHSQPYDAAAKTGGLRLDSSIDGHLLSCFKVDCTEVHGHVVSCGDVDCDAVGGDVKAGGDVDCAQVGGNVTAGGDVDCADVHGNVVCSGDMDCGAVGGDIKAGGDVDCAEVGGSVSAGGDVDCDGYCGMDGGEADGDGKPRRKRRFSINIDGDNMSELQKGLKDMKTELGTVLKGLFDNSEGTE